MECLVLYCNSVSTFQLIAKLLGGGMGHDPDD